MHALFRSHGGRSGAGLHQGLPHPLFEFRKARRPARRSQTPIPATACRWVPASRCLQSSRVWAERTLSTSLLTLTGPKRTDCRAIHTFPGLYGSGKVHSSGSATWCCWEAFWERIFTTCVTARGEFTMMKSEERVLRFSFEERAIHWLAALSFLYAALTGLALWSPGCSGWLRSLEAATLCGAGTPGVECFSQSLSVSCFEIGQDRCGWMLTTGRGCGRRIAMRRITRKNYPKRALQCWPEDAVLDSVCLHPVSVSQRSGSLVSRNHASFAAAGGHPDSSNRGHHFNGRHHRPHLYGHGCRSRSLSRHDSRMGPAQLGSVHHPRWYREIKRRSQL